MATKEIQLLVSYWIRVEIHEKYAHLDIPSAIQKIIEEFAKRCIGSKLLTDNEDQEFMKVLLTKKESLFGGKGFHLLYTASENAYSADRFHQLCDHRGATLVVIESEFGNIFGGYTSIPWSSPDPNAPVQFVKDETAFLFVIRKKDEKDYIPQIYDVKKHDGSQWFGSSVDKAVVHISDRGPTFGRGYSLVITDKCNKPFSPRNFLQHSYTYGGGSYKFDGNLCGKGAPVKSNGHFFSVVDYEVFQIE